MVEKLNLQGVDFTLTKLTKLYQEVDKVTKLDQEVDGLETIGRLVVARCLDQKVELLTEQKQERDQ